MRKITLLFLLLLLAGCGSSSQSGTTTPVPVAPPLPAGSGDPVRGEKLTSSKCGSCHDLEGPTVRFGPSLAGLFNREPRIELIPFKRWDEAALNQWLANPKAVKTTTRMAIPGISNPTDRADIIAWFRSRQPQNQE